MSPRYLVAWSGNRRSPGVLALAAVLARSFNAGLDVVYVQHIEQGIAAAHPGEHSFEQVVREQAKKEMTKAVAGLGADLDIVLHTFPSPSTAGGIVAAARRLGSSMVIIGADHGFTLPLANTLPGEVLRGCPVPVAMVPRGRAPQPRSRLSEVVCIVGARAGAVAVLDETLEAVERARLPLKLVSLVELEGRDRKLPGQARQQAAEALEEARQKATGVAEVSVVVAHGDSLGDVIDQVDWKPDSIAVVGASRLAPGRQAPLLGALAARAQASIPVPLVIVPLDEP